MYDLLPLLFANLPTIAWSSVSASVALVANKVWFSPKEKKAESREDFKAITDSLFKELTSLRADVETYKQDSTNCEDKYNELQSKFVEFKGKYNELELRYRIQININQKISEDIKTLQLEIQTHLEKEQELINDPKVEPNEGFSLRIPKNSSTE